MAKNFTIIALLGFLIAALWYGAKIWFSYDNVEISFHGNLAMILGIIFTLLVGCGLMALMFYSSRHGHDIGAYDIRDLDDDTADAEAETNTEIKK